MQLNSPQTSTKEERENAHTKAESMEADRAECNSLIGPKVFKTIGWNTYDPDNALDAAISAAAQAEDAEAEMYKKLS